MADLNLVIVTGVARKSARLRRRPSPTPKAEFTLEVERPFRRPDGVPVSDLFLIDVYGRLAERCVDVVARGTRLLVAGTLNKESYPTRHGRRDHITVIKCKYLRVLEPEEVDFGNLHIRDLRRDDWTTDIVLDYLDALATVADTFNKRNPDPRPDP